MDSIFDLLARVALDVALKAERLLHAAGLSRRASLALFGLGVFGLGAPRSAARDEHGHEPGLQNRLSEAKHTGPAVVEEVRRLWMVGWAD